MTAGGSLTAERVKELEDMREKFGLSKESAQKIIKGAQNQHLIANMNVRPTVLCKAYSLKASPLSNLHHGIPSWFSARGR